MNIDQQRAAFEALFPVPENCVWCGNGYLPAEYNAWDAINYAERFKGFQAALASPEGSLKTHTLVSNDELQALREDAERLDFMISEECQIQSLSLSNGVRHRLYWPDADEAQCEWSVNPRAAIDEAMEKKP